MAAVWRLNWFEAAPRFTGSANELAQLLARYFRALGTA